MLPDRMTPNPVCARRPGGRGKGLADLAENPGRPRPADCRERTAVPQQAQASRAPRAENPEPMSDRHPAGGRGLADLTDVPEELGLGLRQPRAVTRPAQTPRTG